MTIIAAIEQRHSVRWYEPRPVVREIVDQIVQSGKKAVSLYPEIDVRWYIAWNGSAVSRSLNGLPRAYGMFSTAPHYIIAVSQKRPGYMENLGFRMEQLILTATALEVGTCWIGGIFVEENLRGFVPDLSDDEAIVALTPLGYEDMSKTAQMARRLIQWGTNLRGRRKPLSEIAFQDVWGVFWPGNGASLDRILELTRLAPSWANTQPWRFVISDEAIVAAIYNAAQKGNVREGKPYYRLDGGIAMCHLYLAARAEGITGPWKPISGDDPAIRARYAVPADYDILGIFPGGGIHRSGAVSRSGLVHRTR